MNIDQANAAYTQGRRARVRLNEQANQIQRTLRNLYNSSAELSNSGTSVPRMLEIVNAMNRPPAESGNLTLEAAPMDPDTREFWLSGFGTPNAVFQIPPSPQPYTVFPSITVTETENA